MKLKSLSHLFPLLVLAVAFSVGCTHHPQKISDNSQRETDFNFNWHFSLSDSPEFSKTNFDHSTWDKVQLPHDWSIAEKPDQQYDGATAYFPGGVGWYRKTFPTPEKAKFKNTHILFDGVYNHATVWINGHKLGYQVNGYVPFFYNLSPYLNPPGENNVIALRLDRSRYIDSRWYTGSGIYRNVKLIQTDKLHIPIYGTYITTPSVEKEKAIVNIRINVKNDYDRELHFDLRTKLLDRNNKLVGTVLSSVSVPARELIEVKRDLVIENPYLWDIDDPSMYKAETTVFLHGKEVDKHYTPFGIRTIEYDKDKGFFLNGKNIKIKGVNLHHDAGLVGVAVPKEVWRRRLEKLKEAGTNAIRTAHNPMSEEFLDLCDEMGFLVQAEIFDEWDNPKDKRLNQQERHDDHISRGLSDWFQTHAESDLKISVKRDRNHPSIIMWSIGNEIEWTYPRYASATGYFDMNAAGNYFYNPPFISPEEIYRRFHESPEGKYVLADTAKKLSTWVKELDTTRPVTANMILPSVSHISGYADALDIVGYSYRRVIYDYGHRLFPDKMIMGTENVVQWHEWKAVEERDFIAGTFLWTGIDYLGEAHNQWPRKGTHSGMLDLAGFDKPSFHMMKTLWNEESHIYLTTQKLEKSPYTMKNDKAIVEKKPGAWKEYVWFWHDVNRHWNYSPGEMIVVEAYSNCEEVELQVNGVSLGKQALVDQEDRIFKWAVPFQEGQLQAIALGECATQDSLSTVNSARKIQVETSKNTLLNNGYDVVHVEVQVVDSNAYPVTFDEQKITFQISDKLQLIGVDNGSVNNTESFQNDTVTTFNGRALAIVKAKAEGNGKVEIFLDGKLAESVEILIP